jgi:hypothetical protein
MSGKEVERYLQKFITYFCHKYRHLSKYIDTEQYVIDAVYGAHLRVDYNRSEKELFSFFDKRVKYHLINGLRRAFKNKKMLAKYSSIIKYLTLGNSNGTLYIEMLLDDVTNITKYDVLPALLGNVPVRQLAKINGISVGAMRRWVLKAKEFVRHHLVD